MSGAVHLVTRLNVGGIARFLETARDAVDVLVRGIAPEGETEAVWGGREVRMPELRRPLRPADDTRALAQLVSLLKRLRPDLLHTHASKAGALGRVAARILGIPCVHTFHGHVLDGYFPRPVAWAFLQVERALARHARITATGPATARALEERLDVPVTVVPPGIAMPDPAPGCRDRLRRSFGSPERVALAVARAAAVKELPRFVQAAREAGYLPVVAGAARVPGARALGPVAAMRDVYEACDVVVSASRAEGTPYALLEAAWCARPVVATPVGDVPWVVGEGGILTEDLRRGMERLKDAGLREEMGRAAAARVRRLFPAPELPLRLRTLYADVTARFPAC
jgi:glycosyltransferase involved in cell wall biosynthesis